MCPAAVLPSTSVTLEGFAADASVPLSAAEWLLSRWQDENDYCKHCSVIKSQNIAVFLLGWSKHCTQTWGKTLMFSDQYVTWLLILICYYNVIRCIQPSSIALAWLNWEGFGNCGVTSYTLLIWTSEHTDWLKCFDQVCSVWGHESNVANS